MNNINGWFLVVIVTYILGFGSILGLGIVLNNTKQVTVERKNLASLLGTVIFLGLICIAITTVF